MNRQVRFFPSAMTSRVECTKAITQETTLLLSFISQHRRSYLTSVQTKAAIPCVKTCGGWKCRQKAKSAGTTILNFRINTQLRSHLQCRIPGGFILLFLDWLFIVMDPHRTHPHYRSQSNRDARNIIQNVTSKRIID